MQRKNPRKIAWTVLYRRMHKKGLTEEVTKKRTRKTVKYQRGIVGADIAAIAARRNQSTQVRTAARVDAIAKAKAAKKEKEAKKAKVCSFLPLLCRIITERHCDLGRLAGDPTKRSSSKNQQAADEGREERSLENHTKAVQLPVGTCIFGTTPTFPLPSSLLAVMYIRILHALSCPICYAMELTVVCSSC